MTIQWNSTHKRVGDRCLVRNIQPRIFCLTSVNPTPYPCPVAETTATGRGNPESTGGQAAAHAAFILSVRFRAPLSMAGRAGPASAGPVSCRPVFHPRCRARHQSRGNDRRASNLQEAAMRANASARPEQNRIPAQRFPLFAQAGAAAAALWLNHASLSMSEFRDQRYLKMVAGLEYDADDEARREVFNDAFARTVATSIAIQSRAEGR